MKLSKITLLILIISIQMFAAYISNIPMTIAQPDGTEINCLASGDEFFNRLHDENDYSIIQGSDGWYHRIVVNGWAGISEADYPGLPFTGALIQVPGSGGIRIHVIESHYEVIPNCEIYPVPRLVLSEDGATTRVFTRDDDVYESSDIFPKDLVRIGSKELLRGVPVARVMLYPFQWNPGTKELRYYEKINTRG